MAVRPRYLADKSALARLGEPNVSRRLGPLLVEGLVATCPIVDLEVLYSARSLVDYEEMLAERLALVSFDVNASVTDRAVDVQRELARRGHHRLPIPDLLIAAVAEANGVIVLHYDADFDRLSKVTGQPTEWVVPRGSV